MNMGFYENASKKIDVPINSKLWKEGNLEKSDFKGNSENTNPYQPGELSYVINFQTLKVKNENNIIVKPIIYSYIDTEKSYLNAHDNNVQTTIFYFQVLFDYIELKTRYFQKEVDEKIFDNQFYLNDFMNFEIQRVQQDIKKFNIRISELEDSKLIFIKDSILKVIFETPVIALPKNKNRNFGVAYGVGLTHQLIGNSNTDIKNSNFGIGWYFSALYKKLEFCFEMNLLSSEYKNTFYTLQNGQINNKLIGGFFGIYTGYNILDTKRSRILPYIGVCFTGYGPISNQKNPIVDFPKVNKNSLGYFIGLSYDLKLRNKYIFTRGIPYKNDFNIRFKLNYFPPYSTQNGFYDNTFLISILFSGNARFIKKDIGESRKIELF